jgi:hypothetical protein
VPVQAPPLALAFLLATSAPGAPAHWVGARVEQRRTLVTLARTGSAPRPVGGGPATRTDVTDVAYDTGRGLVYVGTCCEPGSGHLWKLATRSAAQGLVQDDQGFAVDVGGPPGAIARTDTFGTLAVRGATDETQDVRENAGVADVAVDGSRPGRVLALVDARRLRAIVPVVAEREPGLLILQRTAGGWTESLHSLPHEASYCRVVPLADGAVGLLAGAPLPGRAWQCTGDRLDVYDPAARRLRRGVVTFAGPVRHLSIDDSSTFLIYTTVEGAVGWRALDGRGGELAARGFMAADW